MNFLSRFFYRFVDAMMDFRMPWNVPFFLFQQHRKKKALHEHPPTISYVLFSLTIDTEQDHGSGVRTHSFSTLRAFWEHFLPFSEKINCPTTFFLQGDILEKYDDSLEGYLKDSVKKHHEIGVHGYHHELWGKPTWFSPEAHLATDQRQATLKTILRHFEKIGLPRPRSFRAPNLIMDDRTYHALQKNDFEHDSSPSVFKGKNLLPHRRKGVKVIPVSTDPIPRLRWHGPVPFGEYRVLNMYQLCHLPEQEIESMVEHIFRHQIAHGVTPHLVFLAHSWEFVLWKDAYQKLERFMERLHSQFELKSLTFSQLSSHLFPDSNA